MLCKNSIILHNFRKPSGYWKLRRLRQDLVDYRAEGEDPGPAQGAHLCSQVEQDRELHSECGSGQVTGQCYPGDNNHKQTIAGRRSSGTRPRVSASSSSRTTRPRRWTWTGSRRRVSPRAPRTSRYTCASSARTSPSSHSRFKSDMFEC